MAMLYEFLDNNRAELIARCRAKAAKRNHEPSSGGSEHGIPLFLAQLVETLRAEQAPEALARHGALGRGRPSLALVPTDIVGTAAKHGIEMRRQGLSVDAVVHDYGDLCQAMTELALERDAPITVDEFHTFNRCLDDAIADAVTAYSRQGTPRAPAHDAAAAGATPQTLAVEQLRSLLDVARHSFAAIKAGEVGLNGTTSALHARSLADIGDLFERVFGEPPARGEKDRAR
jgi:hypothetical protein